jgi:hypothetical protein
MKYNHYKKRVSIKELKNLINRQDELLDVPREIDFRILTWFNNKRFLY